MSRVVYIAYGYSGIDTREVGRARTREAAQKLIDDFKRALWARGCTWDDFWIHEETT